MSISGMPGPPFGAKAHRSGGWATLHAVGVAVKITSGLSPLAAVGESKSTWVPGVRREAAHVQLGHLAGRVIVVGLDTFWLSEAGAILV